MRCPFAEWRGPVSGRNAGGMIHPAVGVVMHIMGGSLSAADGWFHNPSSRVSAHFGIARDGRIVQWVDTDDRAWHAGAANSHWYGVETEGSSGPLTEAQVASFARLYAWLHLLDGFPFVTTDDPVNGRGFGWHGMGGSAWGGHPYCPGADRRAQRQRILDLAQGSHPTPQEDDDMVIISTDGQAGQYVIAGGVVGLIPDIPSLQAWEAAGAKHVKVTKSMYDRYAKVAV